MGVLVEDMTTPTRTSNMTFRVRYMMVSRESGRHLGYVTQDFSNQEEADAFAANQQDAIVREIPHMPGNANS